MKKILSLLIAAYLFLSVSGCAADRQAKRKAEIDSTQEQFNWWPTDALPAPVKDPQRAGYWWWPSEPGEARPWGNRGYIYVYKIIFDYKSEELPPAKSGEMRPSLLIKRIVKNVKIYFDYDKASLRDDALNVLKGALGSLKRDSETSILITGNCDIRGSEAYNEKLGRRRAEAVKRYMLDNGIPDERIKIVSRGKLDAIAHIRDLAGMQKDRNAQFMVAEVEEIMIPASEVPPPEVQVIDKGKYLEEKEEEVEGDVRVSTKDYVIKKGDSLWKIAEKELGSGHRWKYLYELNKDRIKNPQKLRAGQKIIIPVE